MSNKGRPRIVVRLSAEEMRMAQAAADVAQVDLKHLARMGVLREVLDVRNKLIEQLKQEKEAREKAAGETESGVTVQAGESSGVQGNTLVEQQTSSDRIGSGS